MIIAIYYAYYIMLSKKVSIIYHAYCNILFQHVYKFAITLTTTIEVPYDAWFYLITIHSDI